MLLFADYNFGLWSLHGLPTNLSRRRQAGLLGQEHDPAACLPPDSSLHGWLALPSCLCSSEVPQGLTIMAENGLVGGDKAGRNKRGRGDQQDERGMVLDGGGTCG